MLRFFCFIRSAHPFLGELEVHSPMVYLLFISEPDQKLFPDGSSGPERGAISVGVGWVVLPMNVFVSFMLLDLSTGSRIRVRYRQPGSRPDRLS